MNETIRVIENRKSTRNFSSAGLTQEEKNIILHAAMRAPTAGNMMLYSIIDVDDQALKDQLAVSCDHQPFIARAPFVLLFVADYQRYFDFFLYSEVEAACKERKISSRQPQEGDMLLACCDALISAQTAVIAAESLGVGSCYIGDIIENAETHRQLFALPRYTLPVALVCFGRPKVDKEEKKLTSRFDSRYIVFKNQYQRIASEDFPQLMEAKAASSFPDLPLDQAAKSFGQQMYFKKFVSEFSVEMSRSAREWISNWTDKTDSR